MTSLQTRLSTGLILTLAVLTLLAVVAVVLIATYLPARQAALTDILEAMRME